MMGQRDGWLDNHHGLTSFPDANPRLSTYLPFPFPQAHRSQYTGTMLMACTENPSLIQVSVEKGWSKKKEAVFPLGRLQWQPPPPRRCPVLDLQILRSSTTTTSTSVAPDCGSREVSWECGSAFVALRRKCPRYWRGRASLFSDRQKVMRSGESQDADWAPETRVGTPGLEVRRREGRYL